MDLFFLEADCPITKRYTLAADGTLVKQSYPFVYQVTSHHEVVTDLAGFETVLRKHAARGHTLLKGILQRPLVLESRAGSTDPDARTTWICLDLDGIDQFQSVDQFLEAIGCGEVDYILQWSSSMGLENKAGFRCHVFMLLSAPIHPQLLKYWLQDLNLRIPALRAQLQLTKTYNALRWPLDITTCQNDKLLYIAPPALGPGITDPYPQDRISLQRRTHRTLTLPAISPTREAIREQMHTVINELRAAAGLPKRKRTALKYEGTVEYLAAPDTAVITGIKTERGFVYFNLNGGDSWAYYHPEDNPAFIYNFKGEPTYRTQDLLPEYWAKVTERTRTYQATTQGDIYLAFRDFRTGQYWNGIYNTFADDLKLAPAKNETQLRHFMKQHGQPLGDFIPDWELIYDPLDPVVVDPEHRRLNTFRPSRYCKDPRPPLHTQVPPTIHKVLDHVVAHDTETYTHLLNWLATILQTMDRVGTAWVLHGTQGTGKGILFNHIIAPLLGEWNTCAKRMEEIGGQFNGFLRDCLVLFVDEVEAGRSLYHSTLTAKLKNWIGEPQISIRDMYRPPYMYQNRVNLIFASNKPAPVEVEAGDRRFNVAPRQEVPITITPEEIDHIATELPAFYAFLKHYPANPVRARTPLNNSARKTLIDTNQLAIDVVLQAITRGDLATLWDYLPNQKPQGMELGPRHYLYESFRRILLDHVQHLHTALTRDELYTLLEWCVGGMPASPNKFTSLLRHHNVHLKPVWRGGRTVRGLSVTWTPDPTWLAQAQQEIQTGAV